MNNEYVHRKLVDENYFNWFHTLTVTCRIRKVMTEQRTINVFECRKCRGKRYFNETFGVGVFQELNQFGVEGYSTEKIIQIRKVPSRYGYARLAASTY